MKLNKDDEQWEGLGVRRRTPDYYQTGVLKPDAEDCKKYDPTKNKEDEYSLCRKCSGKWNA